MWNFSSATDTAKYLEALNSNVAVVGVRMTIDYSTGLKFVLTNGDIVGNPQFNFQATNGTVFNVGSCFVDTCTIDTRIDAPGVAGMTTASLVTLEMGYGLVNDEIMYVPIGKYTFQERTSSKKSGKYTLKLQSFSSSLDKKMFKSISGSKTVYDWLKYLCANLTIRYMANTETDLYFYLSDKMTETYMNSLPNHLKLFKVKKNHKYSTWREFVKDLASVSGCFCTFDEKGGLLFTQFRMKSPVKQIDYLSTMSVAENLVKFAVDEVRYSTTNKDGEDVDYGYPVDYTSDYYIDMSSNGLLGNISKQADITDICSEIYSGLGAVKNSATAYVATPFDIKLNRMDFRLQLGDWIAFKSEKGQINYSSGQLMKLSYTSPGNANLFSYQSPSPNDNSSSPTSSSTSGGGGSGGVGAYGVLINKSTSNIYLSGDTWTSIASLSASNVEECTPALDAVCFGTADSDCVVSMRVTQGGASGIEVVESVKSGANFTLNLSDVIGSASGDVHFELYAKCSTGTCTLFSGSSLRAMLMMSMPEADKVLGWWTFN